MKRAVISVVARLTASAALAAVAVTLLATSAAADILVEYDGADSATFIIEPVTNATEVWIELEAPGLTTSLVTLTVDGEKAEVSQTPLGTIAIAKSTSTRRTVTVTVKGAPAPDLAVTVLDQRGEILFSDASQLQIGDRESTGSLPDFNKLGNPSTSAPAPVAFAAIITTIAAALAVVALLLSRTLRKRRAHEL